MKYAPLIAISKYAGMREDITQAGGGNASMKLSSRQMLIKASGCLLSDIGEDTGYAEVNLDVIRTFFEKNSGQKMSGQDEKDLLKHSWLTGGHPSIETFLHSATDDVLTLHTHPVQVNILTTRQGGMEVLKNLFPHALTVDYATPGIQLAQKFFLALQERGERTGHMVAFLKNHGLIVTGQTADEVINLHEAVLRRIEDYLGLDFESDHAVTTLWRTLGESGNGNIVWRVTDPRVERTYTEEKQLWPHAINPDSIVYCGKKFLTIRDDIAQEAEEHRKKYGAFAVIEWRKNLYIYASSVRKAMEIQSVLASAAQVLWYNRGEKCDLLSDQEQDFLLGWDAEKYRKELK